MTAYDNAHRRSDAGDSRLGNSHDHAQPQFGLNMAHPEFNKIYSSMTQPSKHESAAARDHVPPASDVIAPKPGSDSSIPGVDFKNRGASSEFHQKIHDAFKGAFDKLNPKTQEALKGLHVVEAKSIDHMMRMHDKLTPAATSNLKDRPPNTMAFSENGIKKDGAPVQDVVNHEITHGIDNKTNDSQNPEFRKAIDAAIKRLPPEQRASAPKDKAGRDRMYAELLGDSLAMELGSKPKDLAYVRSVDDPKQFEEARKWVHDRYLK